MSGDVPKVDLEELKRLAREATDIRDGKQWFLRINDRRATGHDERLVIATNPAAVLALIERVEFKEGELVTARTKALESMQALNGRVEALGQEVAMLSEALAEEHAKAEGAYARGIEVHADALVRAESDNAALRDALVRVVGDTPESWDTWEEGDGTPLGPLLGRVLGHPFPGAALLDRITTLEALLRKHARRVPCPACGGIGSRTCATCDNGEVEHLPPEVTDALEGKP